MYDANDPRAALASAGVASAVHPEPFDAAEYVRFYETAPQDSGPVERTWFARGQNMIVAYTEAQAGCILERAAQPDEYAVLVPNAASELEITAGDRTTPVRLRVCRLSCVPIRSQFRMSCTRYARRH